MIEQTQSVEVKIMSQVSASFRTSGKSTSISHNNRTVAEEKKFDKYHSHIDWEKTDENIILKQESIKKMYDDLFGEAVENYNAKQKRSNRKIKNYYSKVKNDGSLDLQREFIVQFGDKDLAKNEAVRKAFTHQLIKYYQTFEEKYPDLKIYNAVVHLDEATPHLHMNIIPVAENYKQGVLKRPSFSKWLKENNLSFQDFRNQNLEIMEELIQEMGAERKLVGTHEYERPAQYRETMREAEEVLERSKTQADQIITKARSEANKERYEIARDIREELTEGFFTELETAFDEDSEIPDEAMISTNNYVGEVLDDDAKLDIRKFSPREFLSNFFTDIKKYIKQQFEKIKAKEESLFAREEKLKQRENELEENISKFTELEKTFPETVDAILKPLGVQRRENEPVYFYNGYAKPELLGTVKEVIEAVEKDDYAFWDKISEQAAAKLYESDGEYYLGAYLLKELSRTDINNAYKILHEAYEAEEEDAEDLLAEPLNLYVNPSKSDLQKDNVKLYGVPQNANLQDFDKESQIQELAEQVASPRLEKRLDNPSQEKEGISL